MNQRKLIIISDKVLSSVDIKETCSINLILIISQQATKLDSVDNNYVSNDRCCGIVAKSLKPILVTIMNILYSRSDFRHSTSSVLPIQLSSHFNQSTEVENVV